MNLERFSDRLDDILDTEAYADVDGSPNGLQVGDTGTEVAHAAFAVDAAQATIDEAAAHGADVLITHHGLWWDGVDRLTGPAYDRVTGLIENDVALYASHLPLDGHPDLGNAAGVADLLDLEDVAPFGTLGDVTIGQQGGCATARDVDDLSREIEEHLGEGSNRIRTLAFGPSDVETVAIVTGSGTDWLGEAASVGADVLITGEGKQRVYHEAREIGISVILAGHYATETFGVRALQELVAEWGIATTFIGHPTGL